MKRKLVLQKSESSYKIKAKERIVWLCSYIIVNKDKHRTSLVDFAQSPIMHNSRYWTMAQRTHFLISRFNKLACNTLDSCYVMSSFVHSVDYVLTGFFFFFITCRLLLVLCCTFTIWLPVGLVLCMTARSLITHAPVFFTKSTGCLVCF